MPTSRLSEDRLNLLHAHSIEFKGFTIKLKRDFGSQWFLIDGMPCMWGYVVTQNGMNVMPGATWFQTVKDAKQGIEALLQARASQQGEAAFWGILRNMREPSAAPEKDVRTALVTLESAREALSHVEQHNGAGRLQEAKSMLEHAKPFGWVVKSPADLEPVEAFTRNQAHAEQYRAAGWSITEVFAETSA